ncbi:SWIM zinc finger domain-containing protein [Streptomyces sp. WAC 00631]|uniref:SWIM zinc finger family protein n=1 Tax=Streptomyces sp. WAC 00631 TaxID=2203201 RepID=UPI001E32C794|nr:SWIM zinc finger family protein [Streptomyces sp. WAC 00631]MCC5031723.1 SWIM zinc finger domain-containing protein [Streptomyces sp. WAC 00631]
MTQQGVRWTVEQVLALAPDAASRKAGGRLGTAGPWSGTGVGEEALWGLCEGSGSAPHRTVVALRGADRPGAAPGCHCSCPSRKVPCKHALGLLLLWASDGAGPAGAGSVPGGEPPDWARRWLTERERRAERRAAGPGAGETGPKDAAAARRRAEQRAERMAAGASELERRLLDLLRGGLAGADRAGYGAWEETAARMVDAQAPGLAARVRELAAAAGSGPGWPGRLLEECALLHLLNRALLGVSALPDAPAATVRARAGVPVKAAEVLAAEGAAVRDDWLVLAQRDGSDGSLTTRRTWLRGARTGRTALLLSFGSLGRAPEIDLPIGGSLDAELAPYPGSPPLRVALGERFSPPREGGRPPDVYKRQGTALAAYGRALCEDPWLDAWPAVLAEVVPVPGGDALRDTAGGPDEQPCAGWQLADADGGAALPVDPRSAERPGLWRLLAVSGGGPVTVFGECGHRGFLPYTVWSPETGEAIPL